MRFSVVKQRLMALDVRFGHLANRTTSAHFCAALRQLRGWLITEPSIAAFVKRYDDARGKRLEAVAAHIRSHQQNSMSVGLPLPDTFDDQIATTLAALDAVTVWEAPRVATMEERLGSSFSPLQLGMITLSHVTRDGKTAPEMIEIIRTSIFYLKAHLAEHIQLIATTFALIQRYKDRSEFFRAGQLRAIASAAGTSKEGPLAVDLYTYLHDQGIEFYVEPSSASGEPDLVAALEDDHRLLVDAKYIQDENEAKRTLVKGFRQVVDYCLNHNEPVGFLVVYLNADLRFDIKSDDGLGGIRLGDTTVYFFIVDIFDHPKTASKRPKPKVIEIARDDFTPAPGPAAPPDAT